jgi:hypothetical protein
LFEDFLALTPRKREREERAPEQDDHLSDVLEHGFWGLNRLKKLNELNRVKSLKRAC